MSYILDALRRAEAERERERGQVPGLHTQPSSGSTAARAAGPRRWLPWAGGGLLLLAGIGAGSWWASGPQDAAAPAPLPAPAAAAAPTPLATAAPPTQVATAPVTTPALTAPPAAQPADNLPARQAAAPAAPTSPYLPPAPPPGAIPPAPAPQPRNAATPAPSPAVAATPAPTPAPAPVALPAPPPAPAAEARIPRLADLPEATRRELPKLSISGSVYSDNPASRFVIVNGEIMREGAKLTNDLVLEQIGSRELVLRFKGQQYRQPVQGL